MLSRQKKCADPTALLYRCGYMNQPVFIAFRPPYPFPSLPHPIPVWGYRITCHDNISHSKNFPRISINFGVHLQIETPPPTLLGVGRFIDPPPNPPCRVNPHRTGFPFIGKRNWIGLILSVVFAWIWFSSLGVLVMDFVSFFYYDYSIDLISFLNILNPFQVLWARILYSFRVFRYGFSIFCFSGFSGKRFYFSVNDLVQYYQVLKSQIVIIFGVCWSLVNGHGLSIGYGLSIWAWIKY